MSIDLNSMKLETMRLRNDIGSAKALKRLLVLDNAKTTRNFLGTSSWKRKYDTMWSKSSFARLSNCAGRSHYPIPRTIVQYRVKIWSL